jgi:hypothetical protein
MHCKFIFTSQKYIFKIQSQNPRKKMSTTHQRQFNGRALEMLQTGEGADLVIEVQLNDGLGKVYFLLRIKQKIVQSPIYRCL